MADISCSDSDLDRCVGPKHGKDIQRENLVAGSTALLNNSAMEAAEKFKAVLEKIGIKSNQKIPMGQLVLRYALCVAWIKCSDYIHIAQATESLCELIDSGYASKLPALYLALGRAYFALNRFKKALEFIEKGLKAIQSNSKIKQHSWPGLSTMIEETGKDILQKELLFLQKSCKKYDQPDALCNYDKCLEFSSHVLPSREIYFTDPDFHPFIYLRCEVDCKFAYHNACWEHLQLVSHNLKEPKDLIGLPCSTDKCKSSNIISSKIVEVYVIGQNRFDKPLKSWSHNQRNSNTSKSRNPPDHNTSFDKSDYSSATESSNGPADKCYLRALQTESEKGCEANCSSVECTQEKSMSSVEPMKWKNTAPVDPAFPLPRHIFAPLSAEQSLPHQPVACFPNIPARGPASHPYNAFNNQMSSPYLPYPPLPSSFPLVPPPPLPASGIRHNTMNIPSYGQIHQTLHQPVHFVQPHYTAYSGGFHHYPVPVRPAAQYVTVDVRNPLYLLAGSKLVVPVAPGNVQIVPNKLNSTKAENCSKFAPVPFVIEKLNATQATKAGKAPMKSVVDEFREVVRKLSGEPSSTVSKPVLEPLPSCTSSDSVGVSMKQVVKDFKKLVHDLAGNQTPTSSEWREPTQLKEEETILQYSSSQEHVCAVLPHQYSTTAPYDRSPLLQDPTFHPSLPSVSSETSSDHFMMQESTLQAKTKNVQHKDMDQQLVISSSLESSLCSSQDDVNFEPMDSSRFDRLLEILSQCRKMKFGYSDNENVNPELQCFGHPYDDYSTPVSNINIPDDVDKADENQAQFVFSYYHSVFTNDGHYKIDDLQETWLNTSKELGLPDTFTHKYSCLSEFLLKSERFAAIDDVIGTSDLLPDMFSKAEKELSESVSYLLSLQDNKSHRKEEHFSSDPINNLCKNHHNNVISNFRTHSRSSSSADLDDCGYNLSKEESNGYDQPGYTVIRGRDWNDNPINKSSFPINSAVEASSIHNGDLKITSDPFVPRGSPSKPEKVYMSDDDEEIDVSLTDIDKGHPSVQARLGVKSHTQSPMASSEWSEGANCLPNKVDRNVQTDDVIDAVKEKLSREKELLRIEVSELKYEKTELHNRIQSLQSKMESTLANCESQHAKDLKLVQDKLEEKLKKKSEEVNELREKISVTELELSQMNELVKEKEDQVTERDAQLDKLRRNHAKEINNSVKLLREDKQHKEEEFRDALKMKDKSYIQLWKDFCEFKIKKFNHLCNDRINVLSQLRDLMSDTVHPTKSDVKLNMEKYEELMISVNKMNAEVNEIFNREMERINSGVQLLLPSPIEVPDIMNMHYPPEGAFEFLIKPKQEEFGVPRNLFSPAYSRFYPSYATNNAQPLSQTRENEGYSSIPNSSIFSQGRNETPNLWSNSFSAHSPNLSGMPFEVSNSNGPNLQIPQGFSSSGSLIAQQPSLSLNLLPNVMPYQSSSSQNTSVQGMMGQNRSSPSPSLPFSSMNGSAFSLNASTASAVGTKPPGISTIQKPVPSAVPSTPAMKSLPLVVPTSTPLSAAVHGAIPKPRVQTATASMTPIIPSKGLIRPGVKTAKPNESNYDKLMRNLQKMFPTRNDTDLTAALKTAREKNGNTLSSLSYSEIISKVEEILNKSKKQTSMGWEKFGQAAWGTTKPNVVEWAGTNDPECCICMNPMNAEEVYTLECKHAFHTKCIKKWLGQDSVCPICRMHSTMLDEFPPLG